VENFVFKFSVMNVAIYETQLRFARHFLFVWPISLFICEKVAFVILKYRRHLQYT